MQKLAASTLAILFGATCTVVPAVAQTTTTDKVEQKMERAGDKLQDKADRVGDKLEKKTDRAGDKIERAGDRAEDKTDRAGDKAESTTEKAKEKVDSAMDKVKAKARDVKETIKEKVSRDDDKSDKGRMKADRAAGGNVRSVQQALRDKGHDPGPIDGKMGPRTRAAVTEFQKAERLPETGELDTETMDKLGVRGAPAASPKTDAPQTR